MTGPDCGQQRDLGAETEQVPVLTSHTSAPRRREARFRCVSSSLYSCCKSCCFPPPPSEQTERKGRRTGPGDSTEAKSPHKATRWSAFPVAWSKLLTEQRQGTGKKSTLVNGKHYSPLIPQTHLMTFLGPWGLLFYPSLNHRVLVKLFYYKIHQMLSNKDEQ